MFILTDEDKKLINVDQVRSIELKKGSGYYEWKIVAVFDVPGIYSNIATFNRYSDIQNKAEAEAVFKELCYTIGNTEDRNTIINMDSFGEDSIYNRSKKA